MAAVMAVTLSACGGSSSGSGSGNGSQSGGQGAANTVYSTQPLNLGEDVGVDMSTVSINKLYADSDRLYAIGYSSNSVVEGYKTLTSAQDGHDLTIGDLLGGTGADLMESCIGTDGNYYVITIGGYYSQGDAISPDQESPSEDDELTPEEMDEGPVGDGEEIDYSDGPTVDESEIDYSDGPTVDENEIDYSQGPSADEDEQDYSGGPGPVSDSRSGVQSGGIVNRNTTKVSAKVSTAGSALTGSYEGEEENLSDNSAESPSDEQLSEDEMATSPAEEYTAEEVTDVEATGEFGSESTTGYVITCVTAEGEQKWSTELLPDGADSTMYYVSGMAYTDQGILVSDAIGLNLFSAEDGSFIETLSTEDTVMNATPFALSDGRIALETFGESGEEIVIFDMDKKEVTDRYPISSELNTLSMAAGVTYPMYAIGDGAVYGLPLDGSDPVKVIDYLESDLDIISISAFAELADGTFAAVLVNLEGDDELVVMTQVDEEIVAQRKTLTLGCYYLDYEVRKQVLAFNKSNQSVHISIEDYSQYDSDGGTEGLTKLNTDIASGNAPDLILINDLMPVSSYIAKGVLEDLTPYFEQDEELQEENFLTNILDAFKSEGKMYTLVPAFYALTVVGKTQDIGDGSTFTLDRVNELISEKGVEPGLVFGLTTRDVVFAQALQYCGDQFVDWENSSCNYDSEEFIRLLEFVKQFPAEIDSNTLNEDTSAYYRNGTSLFQIDSLGGFDEFVNLKYGTFGTDITLAGFPSVNATSATVLPQMQLAIGASSGDKDACWSFIRTFLLEDYQNSLDMYWPVSLSAIDARAKDAQSPMYYTDMNGNQTEDHIIVNIGGEEIELPRITEEETEQVLDFLSSLETSTYYDSSISNIVYEEADAFFEGQKSAEDVAGIIQSRVQIYINENS